MMGHTARNNTVKKSDPGMWAPLRRSKAVHTLGEFRFTSEMRRINAAASPKIIGPQTFAKRPYADALTPTVNEYNRLFAPTIAEQGLGSPSLRASIYHF